MEICRKILHVRTAISTRDFLVIQGTRGVPAAIFVRIASLWRWNVTTTKTVKFKRFTCKTTARGLYIIRSRIRCFRWKLAASNFGRNEHQSRFNHKQTPVLFKQPSGAQLAISRKGDAEPVAVRWSNVSGTPAKNWSFIQNENTILLNFSVRNWEKTIICTTKKFL